MIVEDIVTTGRNGIRETIDCMKDIGIEVVAAACIVDRSAGKAYVGTSLSRSQNMMPAYSLTIYRPELLAIPAIKPGSRNI